MSVVLTTTSSSSQTWTVPSELKAGSTITVECWGPGSGGSGSSTSFRSGGAAGAYTTATYTVAAADISVGTISYLLPGGSAGTGAANSVAAEDTWFPWSKNLSTNSKMAGASTGTVASSGTGSPLPTGWNILGASGSAWSSSGLTCTVIGSGSDDGSGRPYIDLQFTGTAATAAISIYTEATPVTGHVQAPVTPSVQHTGSYYVSFVGGALTNVTGAQVNVDTYTCTSTATAYSATTSGTSSQMTSSPVVRSVSVTPGVTIQYANLFAVINITSGAQIGGSSSGITIRIAGPQLEAASAATSYEAPPSGKVMAKGARGSSGTTGGVGALAYACTPNTGGFSGGNGATHTQGGGGGGAAGPDGAGAAATTGTGATGDNGNVAAGVSDVRGGGGATAATSPSAGGAPGAGGGANTSTGNGSAGGQGQIRLTWVNNASSTSTLFSISCSATASIPTGINASATDSFFAISDVASAQQQDLASAALTIGALSSVATISDWAYASDSILALSSVGAGAQFDLASESSTFFSLQPVAFISDWAYANASVLSLSSASTAGQSDRDSGAVSFFGLQSVATISDWSYSLSALLPVTAASSATQFDHASGLASFLSINSVASISDWAYGVATLPALSVVAQSILADVESSASNILSLSASGSASQFDLASGLSTFDVISSQAFISDWAYGTDSFFGVSASGHAFLGTVASASAQFFALSAIATGNVPLGATCHASLLSLSASGSAGQIDLANGLASLPPLEAVGAVSDWAYSLAQWTLSASCSAALTVPCSGVATCLSFIAAGIAEQQDDASAIAVLGGLAASGIAGQQDIASTSAAVLPLSSVGQTVLRVQAGGSDTFTFSASSVAGQSDQALSSCNIDFIVSVNLGLSLLANSDATILLSTSGAMFQGSGIPASGTGLLPTISASGMIRVFQEGASRHIWFDRDDRIVSWPSDSRQSPMVLLDLLH